MAFSNLKYPENNKIYEDDENILWNREEDIAMDTDIDELEPILYKKIRWQITQEQQLIEEIESDAAEHPIGSDEDGGEVEPSGLKQLKRDLHVQALARLEDAARTPKDFENVIA